MCRKKVEQNSVLDDIISHPMKSPYETRPGEEPYKMKIAWFNVCAFVYLHAAFLFALGLDLKTPYTMYFSYVYGYFGSFGITAGAHRLWTHRSYKANRPLKIILLIAQTISFQNSVIEWSRDHRVHHKYSDTNADPHNATRGFFFSHMGWLMCKKHPDVRKFGSKIDMSDLTSDWMLRFQDTYYLILMPLLSFALPTWICTSFFGETFWAAFNIQIFRYVISLHVTWSINSFAHLYGNKPFDRNIRSTDSWTVGTLALGEGWHNYHHVYPWDYKVAELPDYWSNITLIFIDFFAWIGWATDLKTVSEKMIQQRVLRTGDGSHQYSKRTKTKMRHKFDGNNNEVVFPELTDEKQENFYIR